MGVLGMREVPNIRLWAGWKGRKVILVAAVIVKACIAPPSVSGTLDE